jgi:hypothetical protein
MNRAERHNAQAMVAAQAMFDRQVPENDPPCVADWLDSLDGKVWLAENTALVIRGEPSYATDIFGIEENAAAAHIADLDNFNQLNDEDKDAMNLWKEYCAANLVARVSQKREHIFRAAALYQQLHTHLARVAEDLVRGMADGYFNQYIEAPR